MNLLYLTFGNNASIHLQAAFSIYSFLHNRSAVSTVNIITDQTTMYAHLGSSVNLIAISAEELQSWKGIHDFFWRIKIKAIEKVCRLYPGQPVLYLDTDTFLFGNAANLVAPLTTGRALMHENEGALSARKNKTEKKMWQQIAGKRFGDLIMQPTDCMWNAGLVATPNTKAGAECTLAVTICDAMCSAGVSRRLIEQYALSLALQHYYGLQQVNQLVAHYWSTKELWNERLSAFFLEAYFAKWDIDKMITAIHDMNKSDIPVYQRIKNTRVRLSGLIKRTFPAKNQEFVPATTSTNQSTQL